MNKTVIFSAYRFSPDAALELLSSARRIQINSGLDLNSIECILVPLTLKALVYSYFSPILSVLLGLAAFSPVQLAIFKILLRKAWFLEQINFSDAQQLSQSLFVRAYLLGKKEVICIGDCSLTIRVVRPSLFCLVLNAASSIGLLTTLLVQYHCNRRNSSSNNSFAQYILNLKINNHIMGSSICSQLLRENPSAGGSVKDLPWIHSKLLECILLINLAKSSFKKAFKIAYLKYFCCVEPTYLDHILGKIAHSLGATYIEKSHFFSKILVPAQGFEPRRVSRDPELLQKYTDKEAQLYLESRLSSQARNLWYMFEGGNTNHKDENITFSPSLTSAVVFLHSFSDAQYYYGKDDFADIYEWTTFTINQLLYNSCIDVVYIKPHPNVNVQKFPADKIAISKLKSLYAENVEQQDLVFLNQTTTITTLSMIPNCIYLTHHGSVAEELAFLSKPVIVSQFAPWGDTFKFAHSWSSRDEYLKILSQDPKRLSSVPSYFSSELLDYVKCFRLNSIIPSCEWLSYYRLNGYSYDITRIQDHYLKCMSMLALAPPLGNHSYSRYLLSLVKH